MKKVLGFYKQFLQALNIKNYDEYAKNKTKTTLNYYAAMLFAAFIIMLILMLPLLFTLPNKLEAKFGAVEEFEFNTKFTTNAPILIPTDNPLLMINYNDRVPVEKAKIILNNNTLYFGFLFNNYAKDFSEYKDAKASKAPVSNIMAVMLLLMLPTLLLIFFFYLFIKFLLIIAIAALIAIALAYLMKYRVTYKEMFNVAIYGISLTILLDLVFFAFNLQLYNIQYIPFILYLLAGIAKVGKKISKKSSRYIELRT